MDPPTHPVRRSTDDLDLRDAPTEGIGVIDLRARVRPTGGRRSQRQTHTRLLAALARIQANSVVTSPAGATTRPLVAADPTPHTCGNDR